ncbi:MULTISPECIES: GntR family transcriptional regulator [Thalassospira]|uniref:GntR family transcriptional regulator n=1 Tax=Thalassospira povalilytica TaxID=732237 RepID=A0ABX4R7Z4_9PROT|nr:GntR family transcriptional regulator [Thalassospira povalilytica]PKR49487.1 GntR family transcriptional regulator [Thalassospira povalilytica]
MNTFDLTKNSKPMLAPVDVSTVQERVYQSLRLGLLRGEFLPGEQVSIRALANMLGTSAMPVREAIARLIAERAIEQSGPRTLRVAPYHASEHEAYIRIRMQLEGYAAERAASGPKNPKLVDALRRHNDQIKEALQVDDYDSALTGNQAFHFELYRASGYSQLLDLISTLWLRTGPIVASARKDTSLFERVFTHGVKIHSNVIDAVAQRDRAAARWSVNLDIRSSHLAIRRFYKLADGNAADVSGAD